MTTNSIIDNKKAPKRTLSIRGCDIQSRDVLFGRGLDILSNPGNMFYMKLIKEHKGLYMSTKTTKARRKIVREIRSIIQLKPSADSSCGSTPTGGRFLKRATGDNIWIEVLDQSEIERKISQALRDRPTKKKTNDREKDQVKKLKAQKRDSDHEGFLHVVRNKDSSSSKEDDEALVLASSVSSEEGGESGFHDEPEAFVQHLYPKVRKISEEEVYGACTNEQEARLVTGPECNFFADTRKDDQHIQFNQKEQVYDVASYLKQSDITFDDLSFLLD